MSQVNVVSTYKECMDTYENLTNRMIAIMEQLSTEQYELNKEESDFIVSGNLSGKNETERKAQLDTVMRPIKDKIMNLMQQKNRLEFEMDVVRQKAKMCYALLTSNAL